MRFALKSVKQSCSIELELGEVMNAFRSKVNECIWMCIRTNAFSLKKLSCLSYKDLGAKYDKIPSYYPLTAISKEAGILAARKKSLRRGFRTKGSVPSKTALVSCYNFKVSDEEQALIFSVSSRRKIKVVLTKHTLETIKGLEVRSFTITPTSLSLSVRKVVCPYNPKSFVGIDRNASNITCGNEKKVLPFDLSKVEEIARTTKEIVSSFKRNDVRIRKSIASKYGKRRRQRVEKILHLVSKKIVEDAKLNQSALVFEDIKGIRNLYKKGNFQTKSFRGRMNSVPWSEIKRQVEYKAAWEGIPVIQLTKGETRGTSKLCPACGERLQEDRTHRRQLWCEKCGKSEDRDIVAVMNIS